MEDSPLSIVASVTGILTFVAAILGFIYIRYSILHNGREEMISILMSAAETIQDTRPLAQASSQREPEHGFDSDLRNNLIQELYSIELAILVLYMNVYGTDRLKKQSDFQPGGRTGGIWQDMEQASKVWQDVLQASTLRQEQKP